MSRSTACRRTFSINTSDLPAHVDACVRELMERGYASFTIENYRRRLNQFSRWVARYKTPWASEEDLVRRCLASRDVKCDRVSLSAAIHHLLRFLRDRQCLSASGHPETAIDEEVQRFDAYLDRVCGLAVRTRRMRTDFVHRFLWSQFPRGPIDLNQCSPLRVRGFIGDTVEGWKPGSVAALCGSLRAYFRFRAVNGDHTEALIAAVPRVSLRFVPVHTALNDVEIERFLASFDCTGIEGGRNYAIACCLVDLGLRVGEVAKLELDDLDWRAGTLQVRRTKSKRVDVLPVPTRTGQAIVQYLQQRPVQRSNRAIFARHRPPLDAPLTVEIVQWAMRQAYEHAGISRPWTGTHCLRHSLACRMVNEGTSLKEIADVLRHRSLNTTMIYAKSNIAQLAAVALPWPGSVS
jgi:integrase/recombinase XerD